MGYIRHNAIVVTSWDRDLLQSAAQKAVDLGLTIAGPGKRVTNDYCSFLVCPDGSKDGWDESSEADLKRDVFVQWMTEQAYEDGSSALHWIEVQYGGDDPERAKIVRHYKGDAARDPSTGGGT